MNQKLTLAEKLLAVDLKSMNLYKELTPEQKKDLNQSLFILNRYISSVNSNNTNHYILTTNSYYNKHFFTLSKHPELLWKLLCMCGIGKKEFHQWITFKKKSTNSTLKSLMKIYPNMKIDDLEMMIKINSKKDINELIKNYENNNL